MICQFFNRESTFLVDVIFLFRTIMPTGKTVFAQIMDLVPDYELDKYKGDHKTKKFTCCDQFMVMSYAQFTRSSSLRVVETTLTAFCSKLYYSGLPPISYNPLNLPNQVTFSATEEGSKEISYHYDVSGFKHRVEHITPVTSSLVPMVSPSLPGGIIIGGKGKKYINTTTYCGNMIYSSLSRDNGTSMSLLEDGLERILTEDGYITLDGTAPVYHYFLKDHLGNVRVVMNEDGKTVEQSNNYYPFGGIFNSKGDGEQPYKFNGKELETMHGVNWYDYGARMKDDWFFPTPDPLCEKYYSVSPYAFCNNNPINCIDPDGNGWYRHNETGSYFWQEGEESLEGYTYVGSQVSIQMGKDSYFNAYQNAGVIATKPVNAFEFIYSSNKLQNQFLGKDSPLSENSKSELFNKLNNRENHELGLKVGQTLLTLEALISGIEAVGAITTLGKVGTIEGTKVVNNVIKGIKKHAAQQIITRGFKPADIIKIVKEGKVTQGVVRYGSQTRYTLGGNTVVINEKGEIITLFSNASGTPKK